MSRRTWRILSLTVDALAVNLAIIGAFAVRFGWPLPEFNFSAYQAVILPLTVGQLLVFFLVDLYEPTAERSGPELLGTVMKGVALGVLLLMAVTYAFREFAFPRSVVVLALPTEVVLIWGWRRVAAGLLHVRWPERRIILVGTLRDSLMVADRLGDVERWGYRLLAVVCDVCRPESWKRPDIEWIEGFQSLPEEVERLRPDQIIMASPSRHREVLEELAMGRTYDGEILVVPQLYEMHLGELSFSLLNDVPLLRLTRPAKPAWQQGLKALVEEVGAVLLLLGLLPVLALVALAVLVFSGRPVVYAQERLGRDMEPFRVFKFRTMVPDAEARGGAVLAEKDDPRITSIGRLLRLSRIDELPQLYNVARGEMSFVGPRPERAEFVQEFVRHDPLYKERFRVRPGITGLAQVSGTYATTAPMKLRFDLMYIHHQSLSLDLKILLRTIRVILTGRGAV